MWAVRCKHVCVDLCVCTLAKAGKLHYYFFSPSWAACPGIESAQSQCAAAQEERMFCRLKKKKKKPAERKNDTYPAVFASH